jgi:acetyl/propionyl-CoA carboxylase alpha subunit
VNVARSCDYHGAGTVEFLVDDDLNFYFLEMNTRLQVEHCVTEMITGIDLVKEQINVARGETLHLKQADLHIHGHAVELRICAEDPLNNFLPDIGKLEVYKRPSGEGVRIDDGYDEGMDIPIYYDPMIGKLVAWGATRQEAIDRLGIAIAQFRINGIETTLPFGAWAIKQPAFTEGKFDTHFIEKYYTPELLEVFTAEEQEMAAAMAVHIFEHVNKPMKALDPVTTKWKHRLHLR